MARIFCQRLILENACAIEIQCVYRSYHQRKFFVDYLWRRKRAILLFQRMYRGHAGRRRFGRRIEEYYEEEYNHIQIERERLRQDVEYYSAMQIQRVLRGVAGRERARVRKDDLKAYALVAAEMAEYEKDETRKLALYEAKMLKAYEDEKAEKARVEAEEARAKEVQKDIKRRKRMREIEAQKDKLAEQFAKKLKEREGKMGELDIEWTKIGASRAEQEAKRLYNLIQMSPRTAEEKALKKHMKKEIKVLVKELKIKTRQENPDVAAKMKHSEYVAQATRTYLEGKKKEVLEQVALDKVGAVEEKNKEFGVEDEEAASVRKRDDAQVREITRFIILEFSSCSV